MNIRQLLFRPTRSLYRTSRSGLYLCGASTPPGGGVHGMCGFHAAKMALKDLNIQFDFLSVISLWHRGIRGRISFCLRHRLSWRVQASQHTAGHRRRKAITLLDSLRFLPFLIDNLCLNCACKCSSALSALQAQKGKSMQNGSMMRTERHGGPDVWEFRWREPGPDGKIDIAEWSLVQRMSAA